MHIVLQIVNFIKFGLEHHTNEGEKAQDTRAPTMTQMTEMFLPTSGIDPCDPQIHNPCHVHTHNNTVNRENPHPKPHTFLDMCFKTRHKMTDGGTAQYAMMRTSKFNHTSPDQPKHTYR
jgi:hypothetical protein